MSPATSQTANIADEMKAIDDVVHLGLKNQLIELALGKVIERVLAEADISKSITMIKDLAKAFSEK